MILIIENGGTKSDWLVVENDFFYSGPCILFNSSNEDIISQIQSILPLYIISDALLNIQFYTSSLDDSLESRISNIFNKVFISKNINIYSDMLAASRALFHNKKGIACILGTGSNCAFFDGKSNHEIICSTGYLFGDKGSAYDIGKEFLRHYFNSTLPIYIVELFECQFKINKKILLSEIYSLENPKSYIASFSKFLFDHKEDLLLAKIIHSCILDFLKQNPFIFKNYQSYQFGFVGSVSFYFSDVIKSIMVSKNIEHHIVKKPIYELKKFYL